MEFARIAIAIAGLGILTSPRPARAQASARIALKSAVAVHEPMVSVFDLLPAGAPERVRSLARGIILGSAPLPGGHRRFGGEQVRRAVWPVPELRRSLEIPGTVDVSRWSRPLGLEEVLDSIREAPRANHPAGESLNLRDLTLDTAIAVTETSPKLIVTRIEPARNGTGTRVRLWIASEPRIPPFWAELDKRIEPLDRGAEPGIVEDGASVPWHGEISPVTLPRRRISGPPILVKSGQPVQLLVEGSGLRITASGVALNSGRRGDKVRVRGAATGKVLVATVMAAHAVEVSY